MDFQAIELNRVILENSDIALIRSKLRSTSSELTEIETEQAFGLGGMYAGYWAAMNSVVESGMVSDELLEIYSGEVRLIFSNYPGLCPFIRPSIPEAVNSANFRFFNVVLEEIERLNCQPENPN